MCSVVLVAQSLSEFRLLILHSVTLINYDILPSHLSEVRSIQHDELVSSHKDIELHQLDLFSELISVLLLALVHQDLDLWRPLLEL